MLQFLRPALFRNSEKKKRAKAKKNAQYSFEDVPRYPPFLQGLRTIGTDALLTSQQELIIRIRSVLGYPKLEFDTLVLPVIGRYAEYVQLLPASETHHHSGAGGLLRHGLEVGFWAAQLSEAQVFPYEGAPRNKAEHEKRWRFSAFLAGLAHDLGKPISDMDITDEAGKTSWDPFQGSLLEWAETHSLDKYFVRWRGSRVHKEHESFSLLLIKEIAGNESLSYISGIDKRTLPALFDAVSGKGNKNAPLAMLAMRADQESVSRDIANNRMESNESGYGVPVHRYVFDAMRTLLDESTWSVNTVGSKVWVIDGDVFIVWKTAVKDIVRKVQELSIPGVPRDADTLADILIERGYAVPNHVSTKDGGKLKYRYWKVMPNDTQSTNGTIFDFLALRLDSPDRVFTGVVPGSVAGVINGCDEGTEHEQDNAAQLLDEAQSVPHPSANESEALATSIEVDQSVVHVEEERSVLPPDLRGVIEQLKNNGLVGEGRSMPSHESPVEEVPVPEEITVPDNNSKGNLTSQEPAADSFQHVTVNPSGYSVLQNLIAAAGEAGDILIEIVNPVLTGEQWLGQKLMKLHQNIVILYPDGLSDFEDPIEVVATLARAGVIVPDPIMRERNIRIIDDLKVVVLVPELASALMDALEESRDNESIAALSDVRCDSSTKQSIVERVIRQKNVGHTETEQTSTENIASEPPAWFDSIPSEESITCPQKQEKQLDLNGQFNSELVDSSVDGSVADIPLVEPQEALQEREEVIFEPKTITAKDAVIELIQMIREGQGRWLMSPVKQEGDALTTSVEALDRMVLEFPECLSKSQLRNRLNYHGGICRNQQIYLKVR